MQQEHPILQGPLRINHEAGQIQVLKNRATEQCDMGEALTLDTVVNSIDAELIATGPSGKGPNRGAIVRHGSYLLWGFEGPVTDMTDDGQRLFVNTLYYAARQAGSPVLEYRLNGTRDDLYGSLDFVKRVPGYLNTIKRLYVPKSLESASSQGIEEWLNQNRPYLRVEDRRPFIVDEFAKKLGIPNHTKAFLERCIQLVEQGQDVEAINAFERYTGQVCLDEQASGFKKWFAENRDYLYFSDSNGFRFLIDEEAKAKGVPTEVLRGWSSESLNYRFDPNSEGTAAGH